MEEHPIPQDVTGFQFKLIGNMTIKQFAYVAFGVIVSVIIYYLPLYFLIKIPFILFFGAGGIIFAFLPIEGRPAEIMVIHFFKAIFSPNQFVYQKVGRQFSFANLPPTKTNPVMHQQIATPRDQSAKQQQLQALLTATPPHKQTELDEKEAAFLTTLSSSQPVMAPTLQQAPVVTAPPAQAPTPIVIQNNPVANTSAALNKQAAVLTNEIEQAKKEDATQPQISLLERQVQALHFQRQELEQQLQQLKAQLNTSQPNPPQQLVHNIPKEQLKNAGLPHVSDTPNVIVGIVKDSRGNVLSGMLVEVKDKDGNPVRAFKTNQLGQFASATPLATGMYSIVLEDPKNQHTFDVIQISASNQILLPIEIVSRDAREDLRKELFN